MELALEKHAENEIDDMLVKFDEAQKSGNVEAKTEALNELRTAMKNLENVGKVMKKSAFPEIKTIVIENIQEITIKSINEHSTEVVGIFSVPITAKPELNQNDSVELICEAFKSLPTNILKQLFCDIIIPGLFDTSIEESIHNTLIDVGFELIKIFPITNLNALETKDFTSKVIGRYADVLEKLREENYARWTDLWIFLIRFSAKHLHITMDLTNKLLRVVEFAFRNPSYEQKMKGYDCWKELIDNASLDMTRMCSNKQIKLLVTPLRAKFSKMVAVICKRFEVFLYLIEKLQNHSVLCLNEFLEFCFGVTKNSTVAKNSQGKLVPELWLKMICVLLAILGDQTYVLTTFERTIFNNQIITENNIDKFDQVIVSSVIESSVMLKKIDITPQDKTALMTSLWESLFNILMKSSPEIQERCFQLIFKSFGIIFKEFNEDITYIGLCAAFTQCLESSIDHRLSSDSLKLYLEYSLKFLSERDVSSDFFNQFSELIQVSCKQVPIVDYLVEQLKKLEPSKNEMKIYKIWNIVGHKLVENFSNSSKMATQFFLWPVHHLQEFGGQLLEDICSVWNKLLASFSKNSNAIKKQVVIELEKCFKTNPLLASNIICLVSGIAKNDIEFDKEFVRALLKLVSSILSLPLLSQESSEKLIPIIVKSIDFISIHMAEYIDFDVGNDICNSVDKVFTRHKDKTLYEALEKLLKTSYSNAPCEKKLREILISHSDNFQSPSVKNRKDQPNTSKRSVRMAQMVMDSPSNDKNEITSLQVFGKDIDTMSPLKVKGSMLHRSPNSRSKKMINSVKKITPEPPIIDDHTSDFVVIDTEVKLQKDKLTEHQKEEMKRRREDIPALYQDLSQSHSQSESLSSNLKMETTENEAPMEILNTNSDEPSTSSKTEELNTNADSFDKKGKRNVRQLKQLEMNIVGGDSFLKNLPSKRQRRTINAAEKQNENDAGNNVQECERIQNDSLTETGISQNVKEEPIEATDSPSISMADPEDDNQAKVSSNNRKSKLIKPQKYFEKRKYERKIKLENVESPATKNKHRKKHETEIQPKVEERNANKTTPIGEKTLKSDEKEFPSKVLSESQTETEQKPRKSLKKNTQEENEKPTNSAETERTKCGTAPDVANAKVGKARRTPKDIMKKTKEKIRTINNQLKLANLSEISGESKKTKGGKLIFIRDLTDSTNIQDAKLGLKVKKDKKYTIETPNTSDERNSLSLDFDKTKTKEETKIQKKRKRESDSSTSSQEEQSTDKVTKRRKNKTKMNETEIEAKSKDDQYQSEPLLGSPIRITRSRASTSPIDSPSKSKPQPIKNAKNLFPESEDIIESSQDSTKDNVSISKLLKSKTKSPKTPIIQVKRIEIENAEIVDEKKPTLISQADTETCDSNFEPQPIVLDLDLPETRELTDSEKILSVASTLTLSDVSTEKSDENIDDNNRSNGASSPLENTIEYVNIATPEKSSSGDLPSSPVNHTTPTLTKELLDNTLDISPICSQESEESASKQEDILKKLDEAIEDCGNTNENVTPNEKCVKLNFPQNLRSNKLLNMVNVETPVTHKTNTVKRIISSPGITKSRNDKLFSLFNGTKDEEKEKKDDCVQDMEEQQDILTFSREIPSPFAVPSSSILKRKLADTDDNFSPAAKRKRVNFSYPCISTVKHYIRHQEEYNKSIKQTFPQNLFNLFDDDDSEDEDPFANPIPESQPETEESLDIVDPSLLSKSSFFPPLIECKEPLTSLSKHLTSPRYSKVLQKVLDEKKINTIGDLARMSEIEIERLPFKQPRLKIVKKALDFYFTNDYNKKADGENLEHDSESTSSAESTDMETSRNEEKNGNEGDTAVNAKDELKNALRRLKNEGIPLEDLGTVFLDLVNESAIVNLLKNSYETDFKKIFTKSHWRHMIESIFQNDETSEIFDVISDLAENNKIFADKLEGIVQLRIKQNPLKEIIGLKTVVEVKSALESCIDGGTFDRSDVLQNCLAPLIKSPNDIKFYFNNLTILQINDLFVERVQPSDLTVFFDQLREHYGNYTVAQCANKTDVLKICSKDELVNSLIEKEGEVETVKSLISKISDQSKLVEIFKFVTDLVPVNCRIDSYIEFLQSVKKD